MEYVNIYEDEDGDFISDGSYDSFQGAYEGRDDLPTYQDTGLLLTGQEARHYESVLRCCRQILDALDAGEVPKKGVMGLKILLRNIDDAGVENDRKTNAL